MKTRLEKRDLLKRQVEDIEKEDRAVEGQVETRANEAMSTGQAGSGADYVPSDFSSQIIMAARDKKSLFSLLPSALTMPTDTWNIPVEGDDMTWYATNENADVAGTSVPTSKAGTSKVVLDSKKYSASVYLSGELDEDSIISIRPLLVKKFGDSFTKMLDSAILLGDTVTAGTGNINSDDAAPASGSYYLHADGLVKKARSASKTKDIGTLDLTDIRDLRNQLGVKGLEPSELLAVVDTSTYFKLLSLAEVLTMDKFGVQATVVNGVLVAVDGIQILPLSYFGLTDADGKYTTTSPSTNNTKGRIVLLHKPSFYHGFKRQLQIVTEYLPRTDQFCLTAHVRYAHNVVGTDSISYGYNVTV